ncbi:MAG: hypothetical protein AB8B48_10760 [Pseudomonadales bacterium]
MDIKELEQALIKFGLIVRGGFNASEALELPIMNNAQSAQALLLVGHGGSTLWPEFCNSAEHMDGEDHALDRWSQRVAESISSHFNMQAVYPFTGPPYQPFLTWAQRAEADAVLRSRLGMSLHPEFGLWHAYRFALLSPVPFAELQQREARPVSSELSSHCVSCELSPCLRACPVNAFSEQGYDVQACVDYLKVTPDAACHTGGCLARKACPLGSSFQYEPDHAAFHMKAFIKARLAEQ